MREKGDNTPVIPAITDERLQALSKKIRPIVLVENKGLYYVECPDPRNFSWFDELQVKEEALGLVPIRDISTFHVHPVAMYGGFRPKSAEVLAQLPDDIVDDVVAFEIVSSLVNRSDYGAQTATESFGIQTSSGK